jgi:hypothetical protein
MTDPHAIATADPSALLSQPSPVDAALAQFGHEDLTVRVCGTFFGVVPFADDLRHYGTVGQMIAMVSPGAPPALVQRAELLARGDGVKSALWVANALDTADAGIAVFSGLKGAYSFFMGDRSKTLETDPQQGVDAVLKLLGIGYMVVKLFPGSIGERVGKLTSVPAGKQLLVYYTLVEVALPFFDNAMTASGSFISSLLDRYGGEATQRLAGTVGAEAANESRGVIQSMMGSVERVLSGVLPHAKSAADKAGPYLATAMSVTDKVTGVVATGADALPVYRYLVARLAAESVLLQACAG